MDGQIWRVRDGDFSGGEGGEEGLESWRKDLERAGKRWEGGGLDFILGYLKH
jgi:hypothetical protein